MIVIQHYIKLITIFLITTFFASQTESLSTIQNNEENQIHHDDMYKETSVPDSNIAMPNNWTLNLYQLMKDIHELFTQHSLEYWIQGGGLLGAVRHKGLIPWDDDIDINLKLTDEDFFSTLIPLIKNLGYDVEKVPLGYKIINNREIFIIETKKGAPCIDVFFTIEKNNNVYYDPMRNVDWMERDGDAIYIKNDELYPLRGYPFGEIIVLGPYNPKPFLNACFGLYWPYYGVMWNHFSQERIERELSEEDMLPSQPTGPLVDRVPLQKIVRVYASMVADLFHYGHIEFLKKARAMGTYVIIGLLSDEVTTTYKRKPILSQEERMRTVYECKYVDEIIPNAPLCTTKEFITKHHIDIVVHGDDFDKETCMYFFADPIEMHIMRLLPYTPGISTSAIIKRIKEII